MQLGGFFVLVVAGISAGIVFELAKALKNILKNKIYFVISIDFLSAVAAGAIFIFAEFKYLNFEIFGFGIVAFLLGIFIERISLGFLVAKCFLSMYNIIARGLKKFASSRLGKKTLK